MKIDAIFYLTNSFFLVFSNGFLVLVIVLVICYILVPVIVSVN